MKRKLLFILFIFQFAVSYSQTCKDSLVKFSFDCIGGKLKIKVPCNYIKADYFSYTEGGIYSLVYADESSISILCGGNANLNTSSEKNTHLFYKRVTVKGYQFVYDNVPKATVHIFDRAFDLLEKEIK